MTFNKLLFGLITLSLSWATTQAQADRWQQHVEYTMAIDFNVDKHQFAGEQEIVYTNNSPDTLDRVFYHLYFNAFQPGSMMDIRSRTIRDPSPKIGARISTLEKEEIGYHDILSLTQDGEATPYQVVGTILEVDLTHPILPGEQTTLAMKFNAQVPIQIRRSGRDNKEGISYSMAQWYPKLAEYDYQGWHANPYVAREYYGIWGDFDVKITIDGDYVVGGTGYLQNPEEIGFGYTDSMESASDDETKTYHFVAPNVHDFMWGADPDYQHTTYTREDGMVMHFYYQPGPRTTENWEALPAIMDRAFEFINATYGQYPYEQYSFVQGGDGGMEYPMATLITGERTLTSLVGVSVHELMHSWYQMVLGTNESLYAWMDEGFTSYASNEVMNYLRAEGLIPGVAVEDPNLEDVNGLMQFARSGLEEPISLHADHFVTNSAYSVGAYVKGSAFLHQLEYIMGKEDFAAGMLRYFDTWKFKHPNANDFVRVMEKQSGLELDWFREYFVNTTHYPDYGIGAVASEDEVTKLNLVKIGIMPMPVDVAVTFTDGQVQYYTIPLQMMRGEKEREGDIEYEVLEDWPWTHPTYDLTIDRPLGEIRSIEIDPSLRMVDFNRENNKFELSNTEVDDD